ncbi:MAG: PAS domain S-box protein [Gammaproteobacteria bacterium]
MTHELIDYLSFNFLIVELPAHTASALDTPTIKYLNATAAALLGYSADEIIDRPLDLLVAEEYRSPLYRWLLSEAVTLQANPTFECQLFDKQGRPLTALLSCSPLSGANALKHERALLIQDFSACKEQHETLQIMHQAVEQSASAVVITDPKGYIEYVNPKYLQLTGFSAQELPGRNLRMLQSGMTTQEHYRELWKSLRETGQWSGEIENRKKNGERFWAYEAVSAIKNNRGEVTHFLSIAEDISSRKQVESALKESEERFRQMAEMTGEWLWEQSPDGYYLYSSIAVKQILGFSPEEVIGKHYTELLTLQDRESLKPNIGIQKPFFSLINHYQHRDGHRVITESTGLPIKNADGQLDKWRGVDHDITTRKHFQDALIDSEKRKRLMFETALSAIVIMDSYGIVTDWNAQAEKMFGWPHAEAIGQRLAELIIPQRFRKAHFDGLQMFLRTGRGGILNQLVELTALRRDGSEFPVEFSVSPLQLGRVYEFSGFIHDISARKQSEQRIRQAQIDLAIARNEIKIAQQIQSSLLPTAPIVTAQFEITGFCLPADQVGGDYYDYFYRDGEHLDMVIADVSGHSVGPALFMVETRSALRTQSHWPGTPAQTLTVLNDFLFDDLNYSDYFITMSYLQYHADSEQLHVANAGHPPPLLLRHNREQCIPLDADGLILGINKQVVFEEKTVTLEAGDAILLYTDGVTEAENSRGEFYGTERLAALFNVSAHLPPQQIIAAILDDLRQFCRKDKFNDDITLLIFKRS